MKVLEYISRKGKKISELIKPFKIYHKSEKNNNLYKIQDGRQVT